MSFFSLARGLLALWMGGLLVCGAEPVAVKAEILAELKDFHRNWAAPMPEQDPLYGVAHVLSLLNLDHPGLEKVKAAQVAHDLKTAERELLVYFRATRPVKKRLAQLDDRTRLVADQALNHLFRGNKDTHPPVDRGVKIDWVGRAFTEGKEIHDAEWYFQFQRLTWWLPLAQTYHVTRDQRYFDEWRYELVSWSNALLPFDKKTPRFVTRGMETDARCKALTDVFPYMLESEAFDVKTLLIFLSCFHQQADHIPKVYAPVGNHRLAELTRVLENSLAFPEFTSAKAWRNDAVTLLPRMMDDNVYQDGMNKELVFSYHGMYVGLFSSVYQIFRSHGMEHELPADFYPRLLKMGEIYAMQSFPDFSMCQFGDGWKRGDAGSLYRRALAPFASDIPYSEFMVSHGKTGSPPKKTSIAYPQSGFYFFRSDWQKNAVFMALKCAPEAMWHNQIDNGTFELYAYGQNLMIDSGCYIYGSTSPEDQKWRAWFRSTAAHQTLTLDRQDAARKPRHLMWHESAQLVALVVENESYPDLIHRRTVLFIDQRHFLIHDQAIGSAAGAVRVHFQFAPCDATIGDYIATTRFTSGANLQVKQFPMSKMAKAEKEDGWISYEVSRKEERPAWHWKIDKTREMPCVDFLTSLYPFEQAERETPAITAKFEQQGEEMIYHVEIGGKSRIIRVNLAKKSAAME